VDAPQGVRFQLGLGRQAFRVDGNIQFWRPGLSHLGRRQRIDEGAAWRAEVGASAFSTTRRRSRYCRATMASGGQGAARGRLVDLAREGGRPRLRRLRGNAEMRARYLGPGWDLAKLRGSPLNTVQGLRMALDIGAAPPGTHAYAGLERAPVGDLDVGDPSRSTAILGIVVDAKGSAPRRGARFPQLHLRQYGGPDFEPARHVCVAGFDQRWSRCANEYRIPRTTKEKGEHLRRSPNGRGRRPKGLLETVRAFNAAPRPNCRSTRMSMTAATSGLRSTRPTGRSASIPRSYESLWVTTGSLHLWRAQITNDAAVEDVPGCDPGLFAAARCRTASTTTINASGTGLMAGAVFAVSPGGVRRGM